MRRRPHTPLQAPLAGAPVLHTYELPGRDGAGVLDCEADGYNDPGPRPRTKSLRRATLASSGMPHAGMHYPMLDVDHHVEVYASSTPGKHHIYIGQGLPWKQYLDLLHALVMAGLVEEGFVRASEERGYSTLRLPWVRKQESRTRQDDRLGYDRLWSWLGDELDEGTVASNIRGARDQIGWIERSQEPEWLPEVAKLFGRRRISTGPRPQSIILEERLESACYTDPPSPEELWVRLRRTGHEVKVEAIEEARARLTKLEARLAQMNPTSKHLVGGVDEDGWPF